MIQRSLLEKIIPWIDEPKIILIKGSRQVGKTTLLFLLQNYLKNVKKLVERQILYLSADLLPTPFYLKSQAHFIKYLQDQYHLGREKLYVFIDEFQYIPDAGRFLKNVFDQYKDVVQMIVSGSSSLEITKNSEFLTGRKIEFILSSINFKEYLSTKSNLTYETRFSLSSLPKKKGGLKEFIELYRQDLLIHFTDYLGFGGYPEVVLSTDQTKKKLILQDIVQTYLQKDISSFLKIENMEAFNNISTILAAQIGNLVNQHELSNTLGVSHETLKKYLQILSGTYVLSFVKPYHTNIRKELSKMPKVYFHDLGMRNFLLQKNEVIDLAVVEGSLVENFVYQELREQFDQQDLFFYRTIGGAEIDFIIRFRGKLIPIEVKFRRKGFKKSIVLQNFRQNYPKLVDFEVIVNPDYFEIDDRRIFLPVWALPFIDFMI